MSTIADIVLKFNCGCGKQFTDITEAAQHTQQTNHQQTIAGTIKRTKESK